VNPTDIGPCVAAFVRVRLGIRPPYASSPRSRDEAGDVRFNHRFDKHGNRLPLELHGCGCSVCARPERRRLNYWEAR